MRNITERERTSGGSLARVIYNGMIHRLIAVGYKCTTSVLHITSGAFGSMIIQFSLRLSTVGRERRSK